jgi:hypothetical protein
MGQTAGSPQNGTCLTFLSPSDADRAARTFRKLVRHDVHRWALTGGLAIEYYGPRGRRTLNDIDFVAPDFDSLPTTLAADFLFRHVHPLDPPGKTILQFVDPETALRIDVFRACGDTLRRTVIGDLEFGALQIVSAADLAAREARLLLDLADGVPVAAKHARDYLRLVEPVTPEEMQTLWPDHRRPSHPAEFREVHSLLEDLIPARPDLLITPEYSRDAGEICPRCQPVAAFPLAHPREILALLGYW